MAEVPFDATRRRMTTVHELTGPISEFEQGIGVAMAGAESMGSGSHIAMLKGAVDSVLEVCIDE